MNKALAKQAMSLRTQRRPPSSRALRTRSVCEGVTEDKQSCLDFLGEDGVCLSGL